MTRDYEQKDTWWSGKKQSQTKPNKPKFKKAKMNVTTFHIKDYEKMSNWVICPKQTQFKPKQTQTNPISVINHVKLRKPQRRPEYEMHYPL